MFFEDIVDKNYRSIVYGVWKIDVKNNFKGLGLSNWKDGFVIFEWGSGRKRKRWR